MNLDEAKQASANYFSITLLSFVFGHELSISDDLYAIRHYIDIVYNKFTYSFNKLIIWVSRRIVRHFRLVKNIYICKTLLSESLQLPPKITEYAE